MKLSRLSKILNPIYTVFVATVVLSLLLLSSPSSIKALTLEEELQQVQEELKKIRDDKINLETDITNQKELQSEYDTKLNGLKNDINLLNTKISEKKLVIKELELEIDILSKKLKDTKKQIRTAEGEIENLEDETNERLIDMYLSQKTASELDLLVSQSGQSDIIKLNLYQNSIQDDTNNLVGSLKDKRESLESRKAELEDDRVKIQRDEVQLEEELVTLQRDEAELATQRSAYFSLKQDSIAKVESNSNEIEILTEEEKQAIAELRKLEQILFNSFTTIPNGSPVKKGTIIGQQGCTGHCTGPHTHFALKLNGASVNPCSHLPSGVSSCGVGGSSLRWPQNQSFVITSGYGYRWGSFHDGIDIANYTSNAPIYAAHDGYIIYGVDSCKPYISVPCNPPGGKYALICENKDCNVGYRSWYLHLK